MSISTVINSAGRLAGIKMSHTVSSLGNRMAVYGIEKSEYSIEGNTIFFKRLNVSIAIEKALPLLQGYYNAVKLLHKETVEFLVDKDGQPNIKIDGIQFKINDEEELFILCEVFLENTYNVISPTKKPIALIDIGMNVGITSLFFAAMHKVEKVFSYEPFLPTYNMALNNLQLNKKIAGKIEACNFGLAKNESSLSIPYSLQQKGRMGLQGIPEKSDRVHEVSRQQVMLKPASDEFIKIKEKTTGNFVVCKIDCEGAEYEIIDALYEANLLGFPDVYCIEWHRKKPDEIVAKLASVNFHVINTTFPALHSGMLYAIKNSLL